ncbi:hypothetical protein IFM89_012104 [Coptis chinensis]|uniref:Methenyltetrahydrofolate cyclohydrolase n=1 Tax=Coptis chinensis TaxID=261450 RepID=A0A835M334_9MAGN|nr:hypothetical protein IFM89_012104 [Coptis chinensis]
MVVLSLPCSHKKTKYFVDRLSRIGPACKILDSLRPGVEIVAKNLGLTTMFHLLRLLYAVSMARCPTHAMVLEMPLVPFKWSSNLVVRTLLAVEVQTPDLDMLETMVKVIEVATKVLEAIAYGNRDTPYLLKGFTWYPDLVEAFEVWCYRSKVAKRRLGNLPSVTNSSMTTSSYRSNFELLNSNAGLEDHGALGVSRVQMPSFSMLMTRPSNYRFGANQKPLCPSAKKRQKAMPQRLVPGAKPAAAKGLDGIKERHVFEVGIKSYDINLPEKVPEAELIQKVQELNAHPDIHGILVQLPLPAHINEENVLNEISIEKDVDGFHPLNIGKLGMKGRDPLFQPCTPKGCLELLSRSGISVKSKRAVVVGRSNIVGLPDCVASSQSDAFIASEFTHITAITKALFVKRTSS